MRPRVWLLLTLTLLASAPEVWSSEEGAVVWSSFSIHSAGLDDSGPIEVLGQAERGTVTKLTIKAFGRENVLKPEHLRQLDGLYLNAMQLTYEPGFTDVFGPSIYLTLSTSFASGATIEKRVMVTEGGTITVGTLRER